MVRTAVFGVSGFGRVHVGAVKELAAAGEAEFAAAAQPDLPAAAADIAALRDAGVVVYHDWRELLERERPEVVTIAAPVHLHRDMTAGAVAAGAHVLLEKPPLPSVSQLDGLVAQAEAAGRLVGVDFQMLSGGTTRALKELVTSGELGAVERVTGIGLWKRLDSYYQGSPWHGWLRHGEDWSLAGPIANALGHVLNQCLYFAKAGDGFAQPERIEAELYRAHPGVENEDVASVRVATDAGATVGFYVTFCAAQQAQPWIELQAERAWLRWDYDRALDIRWTDGRQERREFGPDDRIDHRKMFRNFFAALRGEERLLCPLAAARAFTAAATGAYAAGAPVREVPAEFIQRQPDGDSVATLLAGIDDDLLRAASHGALLSEVTPAWLPRS